MAYREISIKMKQGISQRLRTIRKKMKLTGNELAHSENIKITQASLSDYENMRIPDSVLFFCTFAQEYGVSLDWLFLNRGDEAYREKPEKAMRVSDEVEKYYKLEDREFKEVMECIKDDRELFEVVRNLIVSKKGINNYLKSER